MRSAFPCVINNLPDILDKLKPCKMVGTMWLWNEGVNYKIVDGEVVKTWIEYEDDEEDNEN